MDCCRDSYGRKWGGSLRALRYLPACLFLYSVSFQLTIRIGCGSSRVSRGPKKTVNTILSFINSRKDNIDR